MLTLTARTRIADLEQGPPALLSTLKSTGLYRDGDDPEVTLGELCWTFGFNPGILLMMLQAANVPEEAPPVDVAPFTAMPLGALVEHIEQTHHAWLREHLPRLTALTDALASGTGDERLVELRDELRSVAAELERHLRHEEEALFPMVRDLAAGKAVQPTRCGGAVGGPIACMENEHHQTTDALARMRALTDGYAPAADADARRRALLEGLAQLDRDLRAHMYKEDEVLFPRALEAEQGARQARHPPAH
jgi:regulator of cell morphogenesis and NO signaling